MHIAPHPDDAAKSPDDADVRYFLHRDNQAPLQVRALPDHNLTLFVKPMEGDEHCESVLAVMPHTKNGASEKREVQTDDFPISD